MSGDGPQVISGKVMAGKGLDLVFAEIIIENGRIAAIEEISNPSDRWIFPAFFNAHTHLGDTVAMDAATSGDLVSLVTPPDGLKHRLLAAAAPGEIAQGIRSSIRQMIRTGCFGCADFREGGIQGVADFRNGVRNLPFYPVVLGRDGGESIADGLGLSSTRDVLGIERIVAEARRNGRLIAFHAGERDPDDMEDALSFDPDLIIHATHATDSQLKRCADKGIPIAVCPRSNWILSVTGSREKPPVRRMQQLGCTVFLGTDNVMFVQPDMPAEMAFLHTVYGIDPRDAVAMAVAGSSLLGDPFFLSEGARANFFMVEPRKSNLSFSKNPVASMVKRGFPAGTCKNVFNS